MSAEVQRLFDAYRKLTPSDQCELRAAIAREMRSEPAPNRADFVQSIRGKYAHLPTSSDAFAARKQEEIDIEG